MKVKVIGAILAAGALAAPSEAKLSIRMPENAAKPCPAIVLPCERGTEPLGPQTEGLVADLVGRGYAVATVEIGKGPFETPQDVAALVATVSGAVTRVVADRRVDADRVGLFGYLAGGIASFHAGLPDPRVRAVVAGNFGFGRNLSGAAGESLIRAAGAKPFFFLQGARDGDCRAVSGTMWDRRVCPDVTRRWYVSSGPGSPLRREFLETVVEFADLHVRDRSVAPPPYAYGRQRLLDQRVKIGGKTCRTVRIPAIDVAPDGTVILVADARFWNAGDLCDCQPTRTVIRRSKDSGRTWSEPALTAELPWNEGEKWSFSDPSLVVDRQAKKVFCFANGMEFVRGYDEYRMFVQESSDNGVTWSRPRDITAGVCWPGIVNGKHLSFISSGHGVQAPDGTLLHAKVAQRFGVTVFGSEDHGRTWKTMGKPTMGASDESKIEVLADGTWLVNSRWSWLRANYRSTDRGRTWQEDRNPYLRDSRTNGGILRVTLKDGSEALLICHSYRASRPRMNVSVRASRDGGRTWNEGVVVDPGNCEYSDLALLPDGRIGVVYEAEGERAIDFVSVSLDEVLAAPMCGKGGR